MLQEMIWWTISSYFDAHATESAKKRCKNLPSKRKYIQETLGMPLQFDWVGKVGLCSMVQLFPHNFFRRLYRQDILNISTNPSGDYVCLFVELSLGIASSIRIYPWLKSNLPIQCLFLATLDSISCCGAPFEDEAGVEGVAVRARPEGQKLLVVGKRFSAESVRQQNHETREEQESAFNKQKGKLLEVNAVGQAGLSATVRHDMTHQCIMLVDF